MYKIFKTATSFFIIFLLFAQCGDDNSSTGPDYSNVPEPFPRTGEKVEQDNGLVYYIIEEGEGQFSVAPEDAISARYTGRTLDGEIFDSSYRGESTAPARFSLRGVIRGYREGLIGMKPGGKRKIIIPPELAYGDALEGQQGYEFRNDTLVFDVELVSIDN